MSLTSVLMLWLESLGGDTSHRPAVSLAQGPAEIGRVVRLRET